MVLCGTATAGVQPRRLKLVMCEQLAVNVSGESEPQEVLICEDE